MAFQNIPSDPDNSTFHHIAYFLNGYKEHGYSAKVGRPEQRNKVALLLGTIGRLIPRYLGNHPRGIVLKVEFYRRKRRAQGETGMSDELIAMFDDEGSHLYGAYEKDSFVRAFIAAFTQADWNFEAVKPMLKSFQATNPFTFDPTRETYEDLQSRCARLRDEGYPLGEVEHFFFACKRRFFKAEGQQPAAAPAARQEARTADAATLGSPIAAPLAGLMAGFLNKQS